MLNRPILNLKTTTQLNFQLFLDYLPVCITLPYIHSWGSHEIHQFCLIISQGSKPGIAMHYQAQLKQCRCFQCICKECCAQIFFQSVFSEFSEIQMFSKTVLQNNIVSVSYLVEAAVPYFCYTPPPEGSVVYCFKSVNLSVCMYVLCMPIF